MLFSNIALYILRTAARLFPSAFAIMALASCSSVVTYDLAMDSLKRSVSCCPSMAQFRYDQLVEGRSTRFSLDEYSSAYEFKTGKSYYKLFKLPDRELPYSIRISSYDLGNAVDSVLVFYPQIALLDDRFDIIRRSSPSAFALKEAGFNEFFSMQPAWRFMFEGHVPVDNGNERYMLVYTTTQLMREVTPYRWPLAFAATLSVSMKTIVIRHPPFARLHVDIAPYLIENIISFDLQAQRNAAHALIEDGTIEPGKRVGGLHIGGSLDQVAKVIGHGAEHGPGNLYQNSTLYAWEAIGLWLIADNETGEVLWISVTSAPASPWSELSTLKGLRFGLTEQDILKTMGKPSRVFTDAYGKVFYYDDSGIVLSIPTTGRNAQKIDEICVFRP